MKTIEGCEQRRDVTYFHVKRITLSAMLRTQILFERFSLQPKQKMMVVCIRVLPVEVLGSGQNLNII